MFSGTMLGELLAVRGDVTAAEAIAGIIMVVFLVAVSGSAWLVSVPLLTKSWRGYESRLLGETQEFRAKWPAERLLEAPSVELQAELERCWQLVLAMELRMTSRDSTDINDQIASLRGWIRSVADALNVVLASGR